MTDFSIIPLLQRFEEFAREGLEFSITFTNRGIVLEGVRYVMRRRLSVEWTVGWPELRISTTASHNLLRHAERMAASLRRKEAML